MLAKVPRIVTSRRRTTAGASAASVSISVGPSFMLRESPVGVQLNWYYIGYRFPIKRYVAPIPVFTIHHLRRSPYRASDRQNGEERSEEHTSELQSLMRISYAVFCLNKNTWSQK